MIRIREIKLKLSKLLDDLMNVIFEEGVTCSLPEDETCEDEYTQPTNDRELQAD
jgi:hypothetical protein